MLFSIIVPIYNVEQYLERCISCVLSQSFTDYELILVDDGSPDKCPEICDKWQAKDTRIKVIHKVNGGLSDARNEGLDAATGEYILFIDSDDYWADNSFLASLSGRLAENPFDVIVFTGKVEYEDGKLIQLRGEHDLDYISSSNKIQILNYLVRHKKFPGASWIICTKHSLIKENKIRFVKGVTAEDYMWLTTIMYYAESIDAMNETVYRYVQHSGSLSSKFNIHTLEGLTNSVINWMRLDKERKYTCMYEYHQRIFILILRCWGRISYRDRKLGKPLLIESCRILDYPNNRRIKLLYKIFGPYLLGNLIYYSHKLWRMIR